MLVARSEKLNKTAGSKPRRRSARVRSHLPVLREGGDADSASRAARGARQRSRDERAGAGPQAAISDANYQIAATPPGACAWLRAGAKPPSSTARRIDAGGACSASKAGWPSRRRSGCAPSRSAQVPGSSGHALPVRVESVADVKLAGTASSRCGLTTPRRWTCRRAAARRAELRRQPAPLLIALQQHCAERDAAIGPRTARAVARTAPKRPAPRILNRPNRQFRIRLALPDPARAGPGHRRSSGRPRSVTLAPRASVATGGGESPEIEIV